MRHRRRGKGAAYDGRTGRAINKTARGEGRCYPSPPIVVCAFPPPRRSTPSTPEAAPIRGQKFCRVGGEAGRAGSPAAHRTTGSNTSECGPSCPLRACRPVAYPASVCPPSSPARRHAWHTLGISGGGRVGSIVARLVGATRERTPRSPPISVWCSPWAMRSPFSATAVRRRAVCGTEERYPR